jgi:oligoribonuclease NrnB/cAMP/cGMP phosphodiesterase (DHH superfamily)
MLKVYRHYGLDGVTCELLLRLRAEALKTDIVVVSSHPKTIDNDIETYLDTEQDNPADELWVVDICPSKTVCEKLNKVYQDKKFQITLVEHHESKAWLKRYPWVAFDTKQCAAQLIFREMDRIELENKSINNSAAIEDFLNMVAAWDLRLLNAIHRTYGEDLHALVKFLGSDEFLKICLHGINSHSIPYFLPTLPIPLVDILRKNSKQYVKNVIDHQLASNAYYMDNYGLTFKVLLATEQHEQIGLAALADPESQDLKYVVIVNPITNKCSFYSREKSDAGSVAVNALVERFGGIGNRNAATFFTNIRQIVIKEIASLLSK